MKKILLLILNFMLLASSSTLLFGQAIVTFPSQKDLLIEITAEKIYEDGTKICYVEIDKNLSDEDIQIIENEAKNITGIYKLSFMPYDRHQFMLHSQKDFSIESLKTLFENRNSVANISQRIMQAPAKLNPGDVCELALPFCTSESYQFPAATNVPSLGWIACLKMTKNPRWYWMRIKNPGYINIEITSHDDAGKTYDVDFTCWGPFTSVDEVCAEKETECPDCVSNTIPQSSYPYGNIVDCSYDRSYIEHCHINKAQTGEVYLLLLTNYENQKTNIYFEKIDGDATTDCGVVTPPITSNGPLCTGDTLKLSPDILGFSADEDALYNWTGPNGWTSNDTTPIIPNVTLADAGTYSLTVSKPGFPANKESTNVIVNQSYHQNFYDTICAQNQYSKYGFFVGNANESSIVIDSMQTINGCDSIRTLYLTVNPTYNIVFYDSVCQGTDYTEHDFDFPNVQTSKSLTKYLLSVAGCDSTITLHLTVFPKYNIEIFDSICQGGVYNKNGFFIADAQFSETYSNNFLTVKGCDSIIALHLYVYPTYREVYIEAICQGENYNKHGFNITNVQSSGLYFQNLHSVNGCDSTIVLNLNVAHKYHINITDSVCIGESYDKNGFFISNVQTSQTLTNYFPSVAGCDSTVTLNLTVNPTYHISIEDSICPGENYDKNGFMLYNVQETGQHYINAQTINGCDSIILLDLFVYPTYREAYVDTICQGENYTEHGFNIVNAQESGVYFQNLKSVSGCDSIILLSLTVAHPYSIVIDDSTCQGKNYIKNGFLIINPQQSGTYNLSLTSVAGCDSLVKLNLFVNPAFNVSFTDSICPGENYNKHGFVLDSVYNSGIYTQPLQTKHGCDSIVTLTLTVNPIYHKEHWETLCKGSNYNNFGFFIENVQESGIYTQNLQTKHGCDSIIILNVFVPEWAYNVFNDTICQGENYNKHGFVYNNLQVSVDTAFNYKNIYNCDSIVELHIKVNPVYDFVYYDTICNGDTYDDHGFYIENIESSIDSIFEGQSICACDSTVELHLFVAAHIVKNFAATICEYEFYYFYGDTLNESGNYEKRLPGEFCDTIAGLALTVMPGQKTWESAIICETNLPYYYRDTALMDEGTYVFEDGCDISTLILSIKTFSDFQVITDSPICTDEGQVLITLIPTTTHVDVCPTNYYMEFSDNAVAKGFENIYGQFDNEIFLDFPENVYPGAYFFTMTIFDQIYGCMKQIFDINLDIFYASSIMRQKWNNLIVLYNHHYNGGFDFSGYQWYRNGQMIFGENGPYLNTGNEPLIPGYEYSVELSRTDGTKCLTCPIIASEAVDENHEYPVVMQDGAVIKVHNANDIESIRVFSYTGQLLYSMMKYDNDNPICELPLPHVTGVVILELKYKNGNVKHADIIVK